MACDGPTQRGNIAPTCPLKSLKQECARADRDGIGVEGPFPDTKAISIYVPRLPPREEGWRGQRVPANSNVRLVHNAAI